MVLGVVGGFPVPTDDEIDLLVYELYDLMEAEISIVEGNGQVAGSGFAVVSGEAEFEFVPFSQRQAGIAYSHPERHRLAPTGKTVPGRRSFKLLALESA